MNKINLRTLSLLMGTIFLLGILFLALSQVQKRQEVKRSQAAGLPQYAQVTDANQTTASAVDSSNEADIGKWIIPSISGFSSDPFTGTASLSYPISIPAGIRGIQPSLGLSYSSAIIDDSRIGSKDAWKYTYTYQASEVGLGWGLGGLGYITKDRSVYPHRYFLVFPGGSARLTKKTDNEWCSDNPEDALWETSPKIFAKIIHCKNNHFGYRDTNLWEIITKDGIHYIFGEQVENNGRPISWNSEPAKPFPGEESPTSMLIYNSENAQGEKSSWHEPNKWMLSHVFDTLGNQMKFHYYHELGNYQGGYYPYSTYSRAIYPKYIEYGYHKEKSKYLYRVEFGYQDRDDYQVPNWDANFSQSFWTKELLKEIRVLSDGQLVRKYILIHEYSPGIQDGNGQWHNHALLTKIEMKGKGGQGNLPPYIFTYHSLGGNNLGDIYLKTADNGYGGKVTYDYEWLDWIRYFNGLNDSRDGDSHTSRARVRKKIIEDGRGNNFSEFYDYDNKPVAYVKEGAGALNSNGDFKGFEFLGHPRVEIKLSENNNPDLIVSRSKSEFFRYLNKDSCFRVDPRKGMAYRTEVLSADGSQVFSKTETKLGVEINGTRFDNLTNDQCNQVPIADKEKAQFFVYNLQTDNFLTDSPGVAKRTQSKNLEYDFKYGHLKKAVRLGEVDFFTGEDINANDNKYAFTEYAPANENAWLVSLPARTFLSDSPQGMAKYNDTRYAYDGQNFGQVAINGLLTQSKIVDESYSPVFEAISRMEYNDYGLPEKTYDPKGNLTQIIYDANYPHFPKENHAYISSTQKLITKTEEYDYVLGLPLKTRDANDQLSWVTYDEYGRVLEMYGPLDADGQPGKAYKYYDPFPHIQIVSKIFEKGERGDNPNSQYTKSRQIFNSLGQVIQTQTINTLVEGQRKDLVSNAEYNSRGQAVKQTQAYETDPHYGDSGWNNLPAPEYFAVDLSQKTRVEMDYDDLGRPIKVRSIVPSNIALNSEIISDYSGFYSRTLTQKEGEQYLWSASWQDGFGRTLQSAVCLDENYSKSCPESRQLKSNFVYNLLDKVVESWSSQEGQNTPRSLTRYDRLGRQLGFDDPDLGSGWSFAYDKNGNLKTQTDAKGQTITFEYDGLNRLTKKAYPNKPDYGSWSEKAPKLIGNEIIFEYDEYSPTESQYGRGRQTKMLDMTGETKIKYDQLGRATWTEKVIDKNVAGSGETQISSAGSSYYKSGLVKESVQPDGEKLTYHYNNAGQLDKIIGDRQGDYLSSVLYNRFGGISQQVLGNSIQTAKQFDEAGRMWQLTYKQSSNLLAQYEYQFNLLGNIESWDNKIDPAKNLTFQYDPLSRLVKASGFYQADYGYDAFGRMGVKKEGEEEVSMVYGSSEQKQFHAPKKVAIAGRELSYQYDANGNLVNDGEREYIWDYDNKPLAIKNLDDKAITYFAYDGAGERILRKVLGGEDQCPNQSLGNFNCDPEGLIDEADLSVLLSSWSKSSFSKLTILLNNWKVK